MSFNSQIGENENNNIFLGLAYHHFNRSKKYFILFQYRGGNATQNGGICGPQNEHDRCLLLHPSGRFFKQGVYAETIAGALYTWKLNESEQSPYRFHAGAYIRWKRCRIPVAKLEMKPIAVSVSYDANISPLRAASRGREALKWPSPIKNLQGA